MQQRMGVVSVCTRVIELWTPRIRSNDDNSLALSRGIFKYGMQPEALFLVPSEDNQFFLVIVGGICRVSENV